MKVRASEELDEIRSEIRSITSDIIRKVQKRNELCKQVGEIKSRLKIDVRDEKVEQEIRQLVSNLSNEIGINPDFTGRLLNILLSESVRLQLKEQRDQIQFENHLTIFSKAKELEAAGKEIIHMEVGEPDYSPPEPVKSVLSSIFDLKRYHYTETKGIMQLRTSIAQKSSNGLNPSNVIITPGGRFAVFAAISSLLVPGDELICIEPVWPAYAECACLVGSTVSSLRTTLEDGWSPDLEKLANMINSNTKMIALNYPNNPTGKILERKILDQIVSIAKDHNLYILSDEVYRDYTFSEFASIMEYGYERSIMISSFSKGHAMTGFRVGYAIAKDSIVDRMAKVQATALTSVAEPMQYAALAAAEVKPAENTKRMKKRLDLICEKLHEMSLSFVKPDGALYVFPKLGEGLSDHKVVQRALDLGVAVAPGSGFGGPYSQFIRLSACQTHDKLEKGLELLNSVMRSN